MTRVKFGNLCAGNVTRKSVSGTYGCGYVLRPLQKAAAVLILAWQIAGRELDRRRILGLANPRTARMAGGHNVMMSGLVLGHLTCRMHDPCVHDEHRRQGHL